MSNRSLQIPGHNSPAPSQYYCTVLYLIAEYCNVFQVINDMEYLLSQSAGATCSSKPGYYTSQLLSTVTVTAEYLWSTATLSRSVSWGYRSPSPPGWTMLSLSEYPWSTATHGHRHSVYAVPSLLGWSLSSMVTPEQCSPKPPRLDTLAVS